MDDTQASGSNIIDLDKYRAERIADKTWPPDQLTVREYWNGRRPKNSPMYDKPKPPDGAA